MARNRDDVIALAKVFKESVPGILEKMFKESLTRSGKTAAEIEAFLKRLLDELMKPRLDQHKGMDIIYFDFSMWLAVNNPGLQRLFESIPQYRDQRNAYMGTSKEKSVKAQIDEISKHAVGQALMDLLRGRNLTIAPEYAPPGNSSQDAQFVQFSPDAGVRSGMPVYDERGRVLPGSGKGTGADGLLTFSPENWGPGGAAGLTFPGSNPDEVLFHEMVHALRAMKGAAYHMPVTGNYDNEEEYIAIVISNIYISSKSRIAPLRGDHGNAVLDKPDRFLDNDQGVDLAPRMLLKRFGLAQGDFYQRLAMIPGLAFNPVRQFDMEENPAKYRSGGRPGPLRKARP